jgi:hypothetical protein
MGRGHIKRIKEDLKQESTPRCRPNSVPLNS